MLSYNDIESYVVKDVVFEKIKEKNEKKKCNPSKYFDYAIIVMILLSSLLLILDNPLEDPASKYIQVLEYIDMVFTIIFLFEAIIKVIAVGFVHSSIPSEPYIMNGWNVLDFVVILASLLYMVMSFMSSGNFNADSLKSLKSLRALRALRPLRMISRNEGMKLVVNSLFASIPAMINVLIVCLLFITIFASSGISFFAGKFFYCSNGDDMNTYINMDLIDNKYD